MSTDKQKEANRYDNRANKLFNDEISLRQQNGSLNVPQYFRAPYLSYELAQEKFIFPNSKVLEIGSGTGLHTYSLLDKKSNIYAFDISKNVVKYLTNRFKNHKRFFAIVADMEFLPFKNQTFDVVCCAGSLSYGDNNIVQGEITRVLKRNGVLIVVDSLNHNPIYKFNRWIHYHRGDRSLSTLQRIPTLDVINLYSNHFKNIDVQYFGSISWIAPLLNLFIGESYSSKFSNFVDNLVNVKKSAFKFRMIAIKK